MKTLLAFVAVIALVLFIWGCAAAVSSVNQGVTNYNQQNPTCQISNPAWPNC